MSVPPKYESVIEWLTTVLDALEGGTAKIILDVNGGAVDATVETTGTELDSHKRKVKVKKTATTHLTIREVRRAASLPLVARRLPT